MCFKSNYCSKVGIDKKTYCSGEGAIKRIQIIYRRATRTRSMKCEHAQKLWKKFFQPIFEKLTKVPSEQSAFDKFAVGKILTLSKEGGFTFGIAQKMFNLFMKDQWALGGFDRKPKLQIVLHLPLDNGILKKLTDSPWKKYTDKDATEKTQCEYLCIQKRYRDYWRRIEIFESPLEMEQFIWQQI